MSKESDHNENTPARFEATRTELYQGPIPHPEILEGFEKVLPGSAERIFQMAEKQHAHRIAVEDRVIKSKIRSSYLGQVFAFVVAMSGFYVAYMLGLAGREIAASIVAGLDIVGLAGVFVYGRYSEKQERNQKK